MNGTKTKRRSICRLKPPHNQLKRHAMTYCPRMASCEISIDCGESHSPNQGNSTQIKEKEHKPAPPIPKIETVALPALGPGETGHIYVVGNETGEYVKIGWSTQVRRRLLAMQTYIPTSLKIYSVISGSRTTEASLHARFADLRANGEWFRLEGPLLEWVSRNRAIAHLPAAELEVIRQRMAAAAAARALDAAATDHPIMTRRQIALRRKRPQSTSPPPQPEA